MGDLDAAPGRFSSRSHGVLRSRPERGTSTRPAFAIQSEGAPGGDSSGVSIGLRRNPLRGRRVRQHYGEPWSCHGRPVSPVRPPLAPRWYPGREWGRPAGPLAHRPAMARQLGGHRRNPPPRREPLSRAGGHEHGPAATFKVGRPGARDPLRLGDVEEEHALWPGAAKNRRNSPEGDGPMLRTSKMSSRHSRIAATAPQGRISTVSNEPARKWARGSRARVRVIIDRERSIPHNVIAFLGPCFGEDPAAVAEVDHEPGSRSRGGRRFGNHPPEPSRAIPGAAIRGSSVVAGVSRLADGGVSGLRVEARLGHEHHHPRQGNPPVESPWESRGTSWRVPGRFRRRRGRPGSAGSRPSGHTVSLIRALQGLAQQPTQPAFVQHWRTGNMKGGTPLQSLDGVVTISPAEPRWPDSWPESRIPMSRRGSRR
jgi:hypothetical protein